MLLNALAVDRLIQEHPEAHEFFGDHASIEHFAAMLELPQWLTIYDNGGWLFAERMNTLVWDIHWFFPAGADVATMRRMLTFLFDKMHAKVVCGRVPKGHPNERRARVINRALGGVEVNGTFALTSARHARYKAGAAR